MDLFSAVMGQPWAIEADWLSFIADVSRRQFDTSTVAAMKNNPPRAESFVNQNGVAVINVMGPIFPKANMMTDVSGATSLQAMQAQFRAALADPNIHSILFNVDSPGGVATGIADFAEEIRAGRKMKPTTAYVGGMGASAAYWIASATSRITLASTAMVGSIGVVAGVTKQVAPDENGEITFEIVSSNAPNKRPDVADSAGRASILARLDALETVFIDAVAANRGVTADTVKTDFGKGGVLMGAAAIAAGMADRIGTIDSVLARLAASGLARGATPRAEAAAISEQISMNTPTSIAELTAAFPELVGEIRRDAAAVANAEAVKAATDTGYKAGVDAERARILGIEATHVPGHDALIAACKADPTCTPADAALKVNAAVRAGLSTAHASIKNVEQHTSRVAPAPNTTTSDKVPAIDTPEGWKAEWAASADLQAEFATADRYVNYQNGLKAGRIRILGRKAS